ncbi:MAG: serine protein kinase RIO [Candidatus Aenigmarchaeota archaeon]|nr:serine protein kinase RIO [Candidatus Aenigmarchaeota archaeon]
MKPKIRLEDVKELKIERKVFDERTLLAIYKLLNKGIIKSVEGVAKEGKESVVFSAKDKNDNWLALKVYRAEYCDFKSMWKYLVGDPRFSSVKKSRRAVILNWCKREFKNLTIAHEAGVSCPKPIAFNENILVIEFIGEDGKLAPRLIDVKLENRDKQGVYEFILNEVEKILRSGLIHSDLSAYNILIWGKPYIIDFSQAVPLKHQLASEFLRRDIKNVNSYFKALNVKIKNEEELFKRFSAMAGLE